MESRKGGARRGAAEKESGDGFFLDKRNKRRRKKKPTSIISIVVVKKTKRKKNAPRTKPPPYDTRSLTTGATLLLFSIARVFGRKRSWDLKPTKDLAPPGLSSPPTKETRAAGFLGIKISSTWFSSFFSTACFCRFCSDQAVARNSCNR